MDHIIHESESHTFPLKRRSTAGYRQAPTHIGELDSSWSGAPPERVLGGARDEQGAAPVFRSPEIGEEKTSIKCWLPHTREVRTKSHLGSPEEEMADSRGCGG